MDFEDFFSTTTEVGGIRGGWRHWFVLLCAALGLIAGAVLGYQIGGIGQAVVSAGLGAFLGWVFGMFLRGLRIFLLLFAIVLAFTLGWAWLTGGFS